MGPVLEWSVIKKLVGPYLKEAGISYISEYPVRQEQERGSLILLDRSEVSFSSRQASLPTDHGCRGLADSPFAASTSPPLDGGFIEVKSGLDFTESNVWLYVQRFKDNILSMHPIIGPNDLDCLVSSFMSRMLDSQPRRPQFGDTLAGSNTTQIQTKQLERSSTSAMVLLVLALGEVCLHRGKIPDLIDHQEKTRSPQTRSNKQPSPAESSYLDSSNLALHQQNKRTSHYSSWDGEADSKEELIVTR
jgi:hypothetical protein